MTKTAILILAGALAALAQDFSGTWKLNTAKSKSTNLALPKEQTVTYTPKGGGYSYKATGVSATGTPINAQFSFTKEGEEAKTSGFPNWDSLVVKSGGVVELRRGGKAIGMVNRSLAKDGKTMTLRGKLTLPDGKTATYDYHYDKQ